VSPPNVIVLQNPRNQWRCVTSEQFKRSLREAKLRSMGKSILRPRALSSGHLNIRRRSCEFSLNSKTLLQLQQLQQRSRLSKTDPSNRVLSDVTEMVGKPVINEKVPKISPRFERRIEILCTRLANTGVNPETASQARIESKWNIVRRHLMAKKLKELTQFDATSSNEPRRLKSNLITTRGRSSQKRSVRWSDDVID